MIGVCVPKDGGVSPTEILDTGARWVRFSADQRHRQAEYARDCHRAGLKVFVTLDSDSMINFGTIDQMAAYYANTFTGWIDAIGIGNEPDGTGAESSREGYNTLHAKARALRREFGTTTVLVGPGLVSGDPGWLDGFDLSLVDAIDVHLYASAPPDWQDKMTGYVDDKLHRYRVKLEELGQPGMPIYMSEIGISSDETGELRQAEYCLDMMTWADASGLVMACWFAYHDWAGFGMVRDDGSPKPAYDAFRRAARWVPPVEDRCEQFKQALADILQYASTHNQKTMKRKSIIEKAKRGLGMGVA